MGKDEGLANSLGLLLQKTNIIRDYLEDIRKGREFWPKEVCVLCACVLREGYNLLCLMLLHAFWVILYPVATLLLCILYAIMH